MPPLDIRQLRDLMRYRFKLVNCKSSEKNRFQNSLTVSIIMISNILTDTFGKTSKSILELILSKEDNVTLEEITPLLRKNLKASPEQILESVQGNLTHEQNSKMKRKKLELKKKEIEDSISFIDWKQNFYDDVLNGKTEYFSYLIDVNNDIPCIFISSF